ncbi:unnamed protein product, partial [Trichogramma brassicae]
MVYFFHHYELPTILQQAQLQQMLYHNPGAARTFGAQPAQPMPPPAAAGGAGAAAGSGSGSAAPTPPTTSRAGADSNDQQWDSVFNDQRRAFEEETRRTQSDYINDLSVLDRLLPTSSSRELSRVSENSSERRRRREKEGESCGVRNARGTAANARRVPVRYARPADERKRIKTSRAEIDLEAYLLCARSWYKRQERESCCTLVSTRQRKYDEDSPSMRKQNHGPKAHWINQSMVGFIIRYQETRKNFLGHLVTRISCGLLSNTRTVHEGRKDIACEKCEKKFGRKSELLRHQRTVHEGRKDFACEKCEKKFGQKSELLRHQRTVHEGRKDFACDKCEKKFIQKTNLLRHQKIVHQGRKDYGCDMCEKKFGEKSALLLHQKTVHEGRRDFVCDICEKKFGFKSHLLLHQKTVHEGRKDFACDKCEKKFGHKSQLLRHQKKVHKRSQRSYGVDFTRPIKNAPHDLARVKNLCVPGAARAELGKRRGRKDRIDTQHKVLCRSCEVKRRRRRRTKKKKKQQQPRWCVYDIPIRRSSTRWKPRASSDSTRESELQIRLCSYISSGARALASSMYTGSKAPRDAKQRDVSFTYQIICIDIEGSLKISFTSYYK